MFGLRVDGSDGTVAIVTRVTSLAGVTGVKGMAGEAGEAGVAVVAGVAGVEVPAALLSSRLVHGPWLGALLDRVGPLWDDRSLSWLDTGHLVDLDLVLRRVLNVDVHQGRMQRYWRRTQPRLIE